MQQRLADCLQKPVFRIFVGSVAVVVGYEVHEGFGVGLAFESVAFARKEILHVFVVFDNPVVDYRELAVA